MVGRVVMLGDAAPFGNHPCVVVLEISGSSECIVVPAFSAGGHRVETDINDLVALGIGRGAVVVTMDNQEHIVARKNYPLSSSAHWMTAQWRRLSQQEVNRGNWVGTMNDEGVRQMAESLLRYEDALPGQFSAPLLKRLRKLAR